MVGGPTEAPSERVLGLPGPASLLEQIAAGA